MAALAVLGLAGCPAANDDNAIAVEQAALALDSNADFAFISDIAYSAPMNISNVAAETARARVITAVRIGLGLLTGSTPCITIDSDNSSFVEAKFDQCGSGDVPVDGVIRAGIDFETEACDLGQCASEVIYQLDPIDLSAGGNRFAGGFELRDSVDPSEPMSSSGSWTLTSADGSSIGLDTGASWRRDLLCVDLEWDATLTLNQEAQDLLGTELDSIAASARNIRRCLGQCPQAGGTLDVAFGQGDVLRVEYNGSATARVTGPLGVDFDVALPCGQVAEPAASQDQ